MGLFNRGLTGLLFNEDVVIALSQAFSTADSQVGA